MGLTLMEVLVRALKKLDDLSFQRFIEKLCVWEVREEYKEIPNNELTGKEPKKVAGLINTYYRYAYGAELTISVLEDIDERKVREELQQDLRIVDIPGHGLGTAMFTDKVNFIDNHRSELIRRMTDVDPVLNDLQDQGLLTQEQYNDVMENITLEEKMEDLCAIIRHLEDTEKYTAYTALKEHNERLVKGLETEDTKWGDLWPCVTGHFVIRHKLHLINNIKEVNPVLDDLRSDHLLTEEQYEDVQVFTTPKDKMEVICDIFLVEPDTVKDQFYISLRRHNYTVINDLEKSEKEPKSEKSLSSFNLVTSHSLDFSQVEESKELSELSSSEEEGKQHQKPPNPILRMGLTLQEVLIRTLKKLEESSFQRFIKNLSVWEAREEYEYENIPKNELTGKNPEHIAGLINTYYNYAYGAEVTLAILEDIDEKKVREELQQDLKEVDILGQGLGTRMFTDRVNFICYDTLGLMMALIDANSVLHDLRDQDLLTQDQFNDVVEKETCKDLYDIIRTWEDTEKYMAYTVLKKYHDELCNLGSQGWSANECNDWIYSSGVHHFLVRHRNDLICIIKEVNPVVEDLRSNHLLAENQYADLQAMTTPEEQMRLLCSIVQHQLDKVKDQFYISLWRYNYTAITDLEKSTKSTTSSLSSNPWSNTALSNDLQDGTGSSELFHSAGDPARNKKELTQDIHYIPPVMGASLTLGEPATRFLERHRLDLISRVIMVDPTLDDLYEQGLLGDKQYDLLQREPSIRKKMTELLDLASNWEENSNKKLYTSLRACNRSVIKDLKRADRQMITGSNLSSSGILSGSHSKRSTFARNDNLKYKEAGEYVQSETQNCSPDNDYSDFGGRDVQSETQNCSPDNDYLDFGGRDTQSDPHENYDLFRNEDSDFALNPYQKERKHFVDEHCWDLIRRIIMVDPVLDDLQEQNLVTQEQYDALMKLKTPQKKMIDLYDIVRFWTNLKKDQVYLALRQHNPAFIRVLEKSDQMLKSRNRNKGSYYMKLTLDLETGSSAGEHFLDKNKSGLINVMSTVDPVVEDLREEGLLTEEQYHNILLKETSKEKMAEIYNITDSFDNVKKDKVYLALRTHNRSHIRVMERISKPSLSVSENSGDAVKYIDLGPEEKDDHTVWKVPGSIIFTIICCICKEMYKTPVTLICGHNYCLECIDKTWNNQDSDDTSCPICRRRFKNRPELNKNLVLCQIAEFCQSSKSDKKTHEYCTYCTSPLPRRAVKHCLLCDAFLCENHLKVHSKQAEHVLLDPSVSPKNRKCSIHKTVLEYYCSQDSACVCSHCCIVGEHKGHQVIPIGEAMEIKKDKLRDTEENLKLKKLEIEKSIKICMLKVLEKAHIASETVEVEEMREILELVQGGLFIEGQAEYLVEDLIRQLEVKRSHLTQCIAHIEELCYNTDPFQVLHDQEDYNL